MVNENRQGRENTTEWFRNEVKIMRQRFGKHCKRFRLGNEDKKVERRLGTY